MRSLKLPANFIVSGGRRLLKSARRINLVSPAKCFGAWRRSFHRCCTPVNSRVTGVVKDTAGAVVPGAKVVLTDNATKDEKIATTNEDGSFTVCEVRPGTYSLLVEGTGFKKLAVTNLIVNVDTPVVLNSLTLEAGGIAETVSVTASDAQSLIRSEDAKLTTNIDVKQVQDLRSTAATRSTLRAAWRVSTLLTHARHLSMVCVVRSQTSRGMESRSTITSHARTRCSV